MTLHPYALAILHPTSVVTCPDNCTFHIGMLAVAGFLFMAFYEIHTKILEDTCREQ